MLAICVPTRDTVAAKFSFDLATLCSYLSNHDIEFLLFFESGSILPEQRNRLVSSALLNNASQILWLDSDMSFPANIYHELNSHNSDIVACAYSKRTVPYNNVAFVDEAFDHTLTYQNGIHKVYAVGMGCMLASADVFKKIPKPWFDFEYSYEHNSFKGEDIVFCELAQQAGYTVYVDCSASQTVKHIAQIELEYSNV
jgi:hypothetical protein